MRFRVFTVEKQVNISYEGAVVTMADRVQHNADGSLDEVVVSACDVHLEHMNDGAWWMGITQGGRTMHLWLISDKRGRPTVEVTDDEIGIPVTQEDQCAPT